MVGMLSWEGHSLSYILYLSRNSNVMVTTRPNLGCNRFGLTQTFTLLLCQAYINLPEGHGSLCWVSLATDEAIVLAS